MEDSNIIKETEIYMLAQFIDVLENIEEFEELKDVKDDIEKRKKIYKKEIENMTSKEEIFDIDEIDRTLDEKIEDYSKLYCENKKYKEIEKKIEEKKNEIKVNKKGVEELEDLIYEKCNYDSKCLFKIGMLEGIKIITLNKF